jgi:predicted component of type VI protein secretion system
MDKCPYCGAETRPGDNFCLNCGNRLLPTTPSSSNQQAQPAMGEATLAAPDDWNAAAAGAVPVSGASWSSDSVAPGVDLPTAGNAQTAQATLDRIPEPGRFVLRSDSGEILQEYPLDKSEIVIGRAPSSDILLSKDKLTSRRHATVTYENGHYVLHDEHSANGTFVNGQQLEEGVAPILNDGDQIGIGEHELVFHAFGVPNVDVQDLPTVSVTYDPDQPGMTYSTHEDPQMTIPSTDDYSTFVGEDASILQDVLPSEEGSVSPAEAVVELEANLSAYDQASALLTEENASEGESEPVIDNEAVPASYSTPDVPASTTNSVENAVAGTPVPAVESRLDGDVTFSNFVALSSPSLPDMSPLMAALSSLDGQIMALQEQFNATQEAMRNHENEVAQTADQLRADIRRVSDRMDSMIADVARNREALAWADLLQLMEDVMNNPRDIEYVTKLARKARELNKVFQIHQNVLNTMAECNSLLRGMIGGEK